MIVAQMETRNYYVEEDEPASFIEAERIELVEEDNFITRIETAGEEDKLDNFLSDFINQADVRRRELVTQIGDKVVEIEDRQLIERKYFNEDQQERRRVCGRDGRRYQQILREQKEFDEQQRIQKESELGAHLPHFKKEFIVGQQEVLKEMMEEVMAGEEEDGQEYVICKELECPVCLTEMLPPIRIWQCASGHAVCQSCKRNPNMRRKCPTCRQLLVGRANQLEKVAAALYRQKTGGEPPEDQDDDEDEEEEEDRRESNISSWVYETFYLPISGNRGRLDGEDFEEEISRLVQNISFLELSTRRGGGNS